MPTLARNLLCSALLADASYADFWDDDAQQTITSSSRVIQR
jgi:hypothetical protein